MQENNKTNDDELIRIETINPNDEQQSTQNPTNNQQTTSPPSSKPYGFLTNNVLGYLQPQPLVHQSFFDTLLDRRIQSNVFNFFGQLKHRSSLIAIAW